jgi:23S rRNA (pseudouridine1915-N3)-methyltransferase
MTIRFIWIGKTRNEPIRNLLNDYLKRIGKFTGVEVVELKDRNSGTEIGKLIQREGEEILSRIDPDSFTLLLDEQGEMLSSNQLATLIDKHRNTGTKRLCFIIGGHAGTSQVLKDRADYVLSLSRLTLTHEMARIFLLEQVYRSFTIMHNLPYQK